MAVLLPWKDLLQVMLMTIVFGTLGIFMLLKRIIVSGPRNVFYFKQRKIRPKVLAGDEYGEHVFIRLRNDRIKLHCVVSGQKDKPLMLFLHGFPEFWYSWRHQIKEFRNDYRTVALDMRGYGESDKPAGIHNYTVDKLVADIDELISLLGYSSCILIAHDWGGIVAWKMAAEHPDKIKQMIICNSPHPMAFQRHLEKSNSQKQKSWYKFYFQLPLIPVYSLLVDDLYFLEEAFTKKGLGAKAGTFTEEDIEAFKYTFAGYGDTCAPINYYRAAMRYEAKYNNSHNKIQVPTLLVWGKQDGALEAETAEISKDYVVQIEIKYIEESSHWVQQEYPNEVNNFIKKFLV